MPFAVRAHSVSHTQSLSEQRLAALSIHFQSECECLQLQRADEAKISFWSQKETKQKRKEGELKEQLSGKLVFAVNNNKWVTLNITWRVGSQCISLLSVLLSWVALCLVGPRAPWPRAWQKWDRKPTMSFDKWKQCLYARARSETRGFQQQPPSGPDNPDDQKIQIKWLLMVKVFSDELLACLQCLIWPLFPYYYVRLCYINVNISVMTLLSTIPWELMKGLPQLPKQERFVKTQNSNN